MTIMKKLLLITTTAMTLCAGAMAQVVTTYPEGAEPLTQESLRTALADKVFTVNPAQGNPWRWQFNENGYFFINAGNYSDSGKWNTKESSVCVNSRRNSGCNEIRQKDNVLYLKRDSGEVVALIPKP